VLLVATALHADPVIADGVIRGSYDATVGQLRCSNTIVDAMQRVGKGGSGEVYRGTSTKSGHKSARPNDVVVKISYPTTINAVEREYDVLGELRNKGVQKHIESGVDKCIIDFEGSSAGKSIAVIMEPYFNPSEQITKEGLDEYTPFARKTAITNLITTMVDLLSAGISLSDMQVLVNGQTGDILFVDLTEYWRLSDRMDALDISAVKNLIGEVQLYIASSEEDLARSILNNRLRDLTRLGRSPRKEIVEVLAGMFDIDVGAIRTVSQE
jgi:hypothetical protein